MGTRHAVRNLGTVVTVIGVVAWMLHRLPWYGGLVMIAIGVLVIFLGSIRVEVEHDGENPSTS